MINSRQLYTNTYSGINLTQIVSQNYDQATMAMVNQEKKMYDSFLSFNLTEIQESNNQISVFPNPMNDLLNISMDNFASLFIMDATGKIVISSDSKEVNTKDLNSGIYFLNVVTTEGKLLSTKLMKN